jgi:PST family polysaccharide transporter
MTSDNRSLTQRSAAGVAWILAFQITKQLLSVVTVSILARRIPPRAYGIMGMAILVTNLLETIRDLGTGTALVREQTLSDELASTAFWLNCTSGLVVTLLVVALSYPAALFFHEPMVARVLQILSVSFFLGAIGVVPTALLNRAMRFRHLALAQASGIVLSSMIAIAIALAGGKISALVTAALVNSLVTTAVVWIFAPFHLKFVFSGVDARRILSFGLHLTGFNGMNYFSRNADNVLVGRFLGSSALGYYQMAYMLMTYPIMNFTVMMVQVSYPAMSTFRDDLKRLRETYLRICQSIALVTFPIMLGLAVTAPSFVRVFLGPRWLPVANLLLIFGPLGALQSLPVSLIYIVRGRPDLNFRWTTFASAAYVLSFIVGLRWGIIGVASCYAIVWTLLMFPAFLIPFRLIKLSGRVFVRSLWSTVWCSVVMTVVAECWLQVLLRLGVENAPIQLFSTITVGAVTYVTLIWWRKPPALSELSTVARGSSHPLARMVVRLLSAPALATRVLNSAGDNGVSSS